MPEKKYFVIRNATTAVLVAINNFQGIFFVDLYTSFFQNLFLKHFVMFFHYDKVSLVKSLFDTILNF
jgi:hypothetical protein